MKTITRSHFPKNLEVEIFEHSPGEDDIYTLPGDLVFTFRSGRLISPLIAWATDCSLSHVAVVVDHGGYIAEALEFGLEVEHISKYRYRHTYFVVRFKEGDKIAEKAKRKVFREERPFYGYTVILSLFLSSIYQKIFRRPYKRFRLFGNSNQLICSAFAAWCLEAIGYDNSDFHYVNPCELGWHIGIPENVYREGHLYSQP